MTVTHPTATASSIWLWPRKWLPVYTALAFVFITLGVIPATLFGQAAGGVESRDGRHVLIATPHEVDGQPVTSIFLETSGGAEVGHVPQGWSAEVEGDGIRFSGPPLGEDQGRFRLDIPDDLMWEGSSIILLGDGNELSSGSLLPPSEYPELEVETESAAGISAPAEASTGELVRLEISDEELIGIGEWTLAGIPIFASGESPFLQSRIPPSLRPGDYASIEYKNEYGLATISDDEAILIVGVGDDSGEESEPSLTGCTPRVFAGRTACICGYFPSLEIQNGLMLDGRPLGSPGSASSRVVNVTIPDDTSPGTHTISGNGIDGSIEIVVLVARGEIDMAMIQQGGTTPLRVVIEGTTDVLEVVLQNLNPDIIALEGGDNQVVTTTGGGTNVLERQVTGLQPGAFDVYYELAEDPCPCLEGNDVLIAEDDPLGPTRTRDPGDSDSTRTRPPWWPEDPEGDDPRDVPEVPVYGEEEDDEEEPLCCGFRGPLLVWPQTTDPLAPSDPMVAPRHPAVGANQVHLPSGAYFQNDRDLKVDAVGISFDMTRHYTSDVETMSGGFAGHRWDFVYNKRLVALGRDYAKGLRGQLAGTETSVVMVFDGTGRALRYEEQSSNIKSVLNFGVKQAFRAYITTYVSPEGEFNELQRYVIEDPAAHPFLGHGDIDEGESIFYVLREKNGVRYIYNCRGQLIHILAKNDYASLPAAETKVPVRFTLRYQGPRNPLTQSHTLSSIEDPSGHFYYVSTTDIDEGLVNTNDDCFHITGTMPIPRIEKIIGGGVEIEYVYKDNQPILDRVKKTFKNSRFEDLTVETLYTYDGENRLTSVISPQQAATGKKPYLENTYSPSGRVSSQRLGGKDYASIAYAGNTVTVTLSTGVTRQYGLTKKGEYTVVESETIKDSNGSWTTTFQHNNATQITSTTLPRGNIVAYEYDPDNGSVRKGPMRNDVAAQVTYHNDLSKGNLLAIVQKIGTIPAGEDVPTSLSIKTEYEPLYNQVAKQTDAKGNETVAKYEYDRQGDLGNARELKRPDITQPDGTTMVVDPVRYEYNDRGQLETEARSLVDITTYTYDETGYVTGISSPRGNETFSRDLYGQVQSWTGSEGTYRFERDVRGLMVKSIHDPYRFSNESRFAYDLDGNVTKSEIDIDDNFGNREPLVTGVSAPRPVNKITRTVTNELDLLGRSTKETTTGDGTTLEISRTFDVTGQVTSTTEPSAAGGTLTTSYTYDARGHVIKEDRAGLSTTYTYDGNGNLLSTQIGPPDTGRKYAYEYDAFDRQIVDISPIGTKTTSTLDDNGNVIELLVRGSSGSQAGGDTLLAKSTSWFNEQDQLVLETHFALDKNNSTLDVKYFYDSQTLLAKTVAPGNAVTTFKHDAAGRIINTIDPVGNQVKNEYDSNGQKVAVVEVEPELTYNVNTKQWTSTTREYRTTLTYDDLGRIIATNNGGVEAAYRYNSNNEKRVVASVGGGLIETRYDGVGRPVEVLAGGRLQKLSYTPAGQLAEMQAPNVHQKWKYDAFGLEIESTDVLSKAVTTIKRDAIGNPLEVTDANGTITRITVNGLGLPTNEDIIPGSGTVSNGGLTLNYVGGAFNTWRRYDGLGRLRYTQNGYQARFRDAAVGFEYDGLGRITKETQILYDTGQTIERTYAADNSWVDTRYPELTGSDVVRRNFDALGRITRVDLDGDMIASYAYSGSDRIAASSLRNGTVSLYTYDANRRLSDVKIYADAGDFGRNPAIIWSAKASYDNVGRLTSNFVADQGNYTTSESKYTYDDEGRKTGSVTTTRVSGAKPSITVSSLLSSFDGTRPIMQAEVLVETLGEKPNAVFARVQKFEYDGSKVSAVTTTARNKFSGTVPTDLNTPNEISDWISGDGAFTDKQSFTYDAVGNLIADDANLYTYDANQRLLIVAQIPGNRPYNQSVLFSYDPLGRRISTFPDRDRVPGGFVNFDPWTKQSIKYLYDGPNTIAELVNAEGVGTTLLARYLPGARPGERVRMDRRTNDDPKAELHEYYLHAGFQGDIALLTDGSGKSLYTSAPSDTQAGSALAPPDELRLISGSKTRVPYIGWSTRIDGFAGTKYDEQSRSAIYDYRTSTTLAEAMDMAAYRESITAMQNRGALALGVVTMAALAPGAAALEGLISVGLNWYAASSTQAGYTAGEASEHFASGMLSGGLGKLVPGGSSAISKLAADYATGFTGGVAFDVGWRGRTWTDAASDNVVGAAAMAAVGTGLRLGVAGAGIGFKRARSAYQSRQHAASPTYANIEVPGSKTTKRDMSGIDGNVFDHILEGKVRKYSENAFQIEMLNLLRNGRSYHRFIAEMIMKKKLVVLWDRNMPDHVAGGWNPETPTALYLNPNIVARHPRFSLQVTSTIVHEATHALGGGEPAAFLAQGAFLHHWKYRAKKAGPTGYGNKVQFIVDPSYKLTLDTYMDTRRTSLIQPLKDMLKSKGYSSTKRAYFMQTEFINAYHYFVIKAGGWRKILHLDPALDQALNVYAGSAFGY